jgi:cell division protein FtsB
VLEVITAKVAGISYGMAYVLSAYAAPDVNVILNLLGLLAIVWFGPRYLKTRDLQAQLAAKDQAIATNAQTIIALERRIDALLDELRGAQERANLSGDRAERAEQREHEWKARYDEQARYTAGPAFEKLQHVIADLAAEMDKRHAETIALIARLAGEKSVTDPGGFS